MSLATATIQFDISDKVGANFDASRTKVWATTNVESVHDTLGHETRVGGGSGTINSSGVGSIVVWKPGTGSNPASWQTTIHVDFPDRFAPKGSDGRKRLDYGPFTITTSGWLDTLVQEQEVPPTYISTVTALLDGYVTDAENAAAVAEFEATRSGTEATRSGTEADRAATEADRARDISNIVVIDDAMEAVRADEDSAFAHGLSASIDAGVDPVKDQAIDAAFINAGGSDLSVLAPVHDGIEAVRDQAADFRLLIPGDSKMAGLVSDGPAITGNSPPKLLVDYLNRYVARTQYTWMQPPGEMTVGPGGFDPRWVLGNGWGATLEEYGFAGMGAFFAPGTATTAALQGIPGWTADTFWIYYLSNNGGGAGLGTLTAIATGGSATVIDATTQALGVRKALVTCPTGHADRVLSMIKSLGGFFVLGVEAYDSTYKSIHVMNAAVCSSRMWSDGSGGWAGWGSPDDTTHSTAMIRLIAPQLTFLDILTNDGQAPYGAPTDPDDWEDGARNLIAAAQESGVVVLKTPPPAGVNGDAPNTLAREKAILLRYLPLAKETGCFFLDSFANFGTWELALEKGWMHPADPLHLLPAGSRAEAASMGRVIAQGVDFNPGISPDVEEALEEKAPLAEGVNVVGATGSTETLPDVSVATMHSLTLTADCTLTFPAAGAGKSFTLALNQDATGGRTVVWPGNVYWGGGTPPTLTTSPGRSDVFSFRCFNGTAWIGRVEDLDVH